MHGSFEEALKQRNISHRRQVCTATLCSFRIGGVAAWVLEPECVGELIDAVLLCEEYRMPYEVIGLGSNLLFGDGDIETVLIRTTALNALRMTEGGIRALCGVSLARLAFCSASAGFADLCFVAGIPGTLGGAIFMNAGAHGAEIGSLVESALLFDVNAKNMIRVSADELAFAYRESLLQHRKLVLISATIKLESRADTDECKRKIQEMLTRRRATQPIDLPSGGSVFKRAESKEPISALIDRLGLKGMSVGGAQISQKHAGFIVNTGTATARDVLGLAEQIQKIVEKEKGIVPRLEIRYIPDKI